MDYYRKRLPTERRQPNGEIIEHNTVWTEEEILAWLNYQKLLEDDLALDMLHTYTERGFLADRDTISNVMRRINKNVDEL